MSHAHGIPHRPLGRTGVSVSCLGLGGYHLGLVPSSAEAERLVHAAVGEGITFMDSAWEYHNGESEARLGRALRGLGSKRQDVFLMTKCCSHGAGKEAALRQLDESLRRLGADHLDLWQLHEVVWEDDPDRYARVGGELEALAEAKQSGKVRFVGFTGHRDPALLAAMLATGFPFDTCQLPINAFDASFRSFGSLLPQIAARGLAALGMKSLSGSGDPVRAGVLTAEEAIAWSLAQPIASLIVGIDSQAVLEQDLRIARGEVLSPDAQVALVQRVAAAAQDGRFEPFKVSDAFHGPEGRRARGLPIPA